MRGRGLPAAAVLVVAGLVSWVWRHSGLEQASWLAAVLALFGALAGWWWRLGRGPGGQDGEALADYAAAGLARAVRDQWQREESLRRVAEPIPLPVRWVTVPPGLADHWANIRRDPDPRTGGTPLWLDGALDQVAEVFARVPSRRLVVLGPGGAGKTVLAMRFTLDLLAGPDRDPVLAGRVPVIFRMATWDPQVQTLAEWMSAQLQADDVGLRARPGAGRTLAAELVGRQRVLPVLDGLDEMPEPMRARAVSAINTELPVTEPFLLTSRNDQNDYGTAVAAAGVLAAAAVIELRPLNLADLADYLPRSTRPGQAGKWQPVLDHLAGHRTDPAAAARLGVLTSPLMTFLARTAYSDTSADPADPETGILADNHADPARLEDHLLAAFIPAVYRAETRPPHSAEQATRALTYLAQHTGPANDIAWWRLYNTLPRRARRAAAFTVWLALWLGLGVMLVPDFGFGGLGVALVFGLGSGLVYAPMAERLAGTGTPRVIRFSGPSVRRGLPFGLAGGLFVGLLAGLPDGPRAGGLTVGLAVGLAVAPAFVLAAVLGLDSDPGRITGPPDSYREDRWFTIAVMLAIGLAVGLNLGLAAGLAGGLGTGLTGGLTSGLAVGLATGLLAYSGMPSGEFLIARRWLARRGLLPWPVMAFLDDAHRRGVLRQAGAVYQFRHDRLRQHLRT